LVLMATTSKVNNSRHGLDHDSLRAVTCLTDTRVPNQRANIQRAARSREVARRTDQTISAERRRSSITESHRTRQIVKGSSHEIIKDNQYPIELFPSDLGLSQSAHCAGQHNDRPAGDEHDNSESNQLG